MGLDLWTDGVDTYVAHSAEEASAMQANLIDDEASPPGDWSLYPEKETITIVDDDVPGGKVTRTREDWIATNGPGFAWSTEW